MSTLREQTLDNFRLEITDDGVESTGNPDTPFMVVIYEDDDFQDDMPCKTREEADAVFDCLVGSYKTNGFCRF